MIKAVIFDWGGTLPPWHTVDFTECWTSAVGVDDPASAVFVGDRVYDDIHGAKPVGMRAVLVPHSTIPAEPVGPLAGRPDAVVTRLSEVLDLVDTWH